MLQIYKGLFLFFPILKRYELHFRRSYLAQMLIFVNSMYIIVKLIRKYAVLVS
jgi:hypothetical protein